MQYLTHSPDHTLLAAIGSTIVQVWNTKTGKKLADFAWESNNTSFCIKNDGTVVGINKLGDIELWSISKGTLIERRNLLAGFEKPKDTSTQIEVMLTWVLSPDGRTLVAHLGQKKGRPGQKQGPEGDYGKVVVAWDIATGKELWRQFDKDTGYGFLFSPDGKWFAQHVGWNGELGELICCDAATAQVKARVVLDKIDPRIGVIRSSDRPALPVRARAIALIARPWFLQRTARSWCFGTRQGNNRSKKLLCCQAIAVRVALHLGICRTSPFRQMGNHSWRLATNTFNSSIWRRENCSCHGRDIARPLSSWHTPSTAVPSLAAVDGCEVTLVLN